MFDYQWMGCIDNRFWLHSRDHSRALTQMYNFGAETPLSAGVMSAFVFSMAAIVQALASTFVGSTALRKAHEDSEYTAMNAVMHWHLGAKITLVAKLWVL